MKNSTAASLIRLWGQAEMFPVTLKEKLIAPNLRLYDDEEMLQKVNEWADEFDSGNYEDFVEFFYNKASTL